jgi:hypothetical protein
MPVRGLIMSVPHKGPYYEGFVRRLFFKICADALQGKCRPPILNGQARTVAEMQATVAYARKWGFLA